MLNVFICISFNCTVNDDRGFALKATLNLVIIQFSVYASKSEYESYANKANQ